MSEKAWKRLEFVINVAYFAVIVGLIYLAWNHVLSWVLPFVLAFFIVSIVHPIIRWIKRKLHIEREIISLIIMILIYVALCSLLVFLGAQLVYWLQDVLADFEGSVMPLISDIGAALNRLFEALPEPIRIEVTGRQDDLLRALQDILLGLSNSLISAFTSFTARIPTFVLALIFTVMLSFFMSMQYTKVTGYLRGLLPQKLDKQMGQIKLVMKDTVLRYLKAISTLMFITAAELSVGLLLLGKSNAIPIAFGIALFDALPFFGTGAIMIPWVLLELLRQNYTFGLWLGILYGVVTLVRNIIEPKIVSDKLGINPIVSLVAIYLGFRTMGVLGMIFMPIIVQIVFALYEAGTLPVLHRVFSPGRTPEPPPQQNKPEE